jgi:hypothetical protein
LPEARPEAKSAQATNVSSPEPFAYVHPRRKADTAAAAAAAAFPVAHLVGPRRGVVSTMTIDPRNVSSLGGPIAMENLLARLTMPQDSISMFNNSSRIDLSMPTLSAGGSSLYPLLSATCKDSALRGLSTPRPPMEQPLSSLPPLNQVLSMAERLAEKQAMEHMLQAVRQIQPREQLLHPFRYTSLLTLQDLLGRKSCKLW